MEYRRIDVDTHLQEKPDTWTSRMSKSRWGELIPHLEEYTPPPEASKTGGPAYKVARTAKPNQRWVINGTPRGSPSLCHAVMPDKETLPGRWEDVPPSVYQARERLHAMDLDGVDCQVFYPNVSGGSADAFQGADPEYEAEAVRAYNDYQIEEFVSLSPERFVALTILPLSDIERAVSEVSYARKIGHRGMIMTSAPEQRGLPFFNDPHWDPLWDVAQDMDVPVHFHGSGGTRRMRIDLMPGMSSRRNRAITGSIGFNLQGQYMSNFLFSGVFDRFPKLTFVVAETGIGWMPYVLEACDYEWEQCQLWKHGFPRLPSEVFREHVYVDFWYEQEGLKHRHFIGVDRIMWESDFPHPTSLWPESDKYVELSLAGVPEDERRMILVENARRVYKL